MELGPSSSHGAAPATRAGMAALRGDSGGVQA